MPTGRKRSPPATRRRALELIAWSPDGMTEAMLLAHGLTVETLVDLIRAGLATQTVGPAAQILIDVISHHVNQGSLPAEAAEAVRTALDGSIESLAQDHWMDREISCVTVFGGTGFVGRRVARHLRGSGTSIRIASRHPRRAEGDSLEQIVRGKHLALRERL